MENKAESKATLTAISARLQAIIIAHKAGKPVIAEMAKRIAERTDRLERERTDSLIREALG